MAWPIVAAAAIGAAGNMVAGAQAGKAATEARDAAERAQRSASRAAIKRLEEIGLPSLEAQKIVLEQPDLIQELFPDIVGDSSLVQVSEDPQLRDAQMSAISQLREMGVQGLTAQDVQQRDQLLDDEARRMQSEQQGLMRSMAERGALDSGAQLAMQLASQQGSAARGQDAALQMAAQRQQARQSAITNLAGTASQMSQQDYQRQSELARARDEIGRANAAARTGAQQFNITNKQNVANQAANIANQQEMYNKGLIRTQYQDKLDKERILQGIESKQADNIAQYSMMGGQGEAQRLSSMGKTVGDLATTVGSYYAKQEEQEEPTVKNKVPGKV